MYITVTTNYDLVKKKRIEDTCPNCGQSNCLELEFFQIRTSTPFIKKVTKKITGILFCHHTKTEIQPVQWSNLIEKRFLTEKKQLVLQPSGFKLTKWFYIVMLLPFLLFAIMILFEHHHS